MSQEVKAVGRPTDYNPELCNELIDFFDRPYYIQREFVHGPKNNTKVEIITEPNRIPSVEAFLREKKILKGTFYRWVERHTELSDALAHSRSILKDFLNHHALHGNFNSAYAKFFAINATDMRDQPKVEVSGNNTIKLAYSVGDNEVQE